ncbi:hypothetical protein FH972_026457 [Carpinus fangiana]|uniref:Rhodopsin domain-containing protein n=1 Tax=Carpinus fangiana TaxID=176857 RepID=A0A5N6L420_9ROSI|nr:hypothetical protein FH972_026457 [Carpinus fangiana]
MPGGIEPPLSVIVGWPPPNHVDPETRGPALLILIILLGVLAVITVAARFYCRLFLTKNAGADDWMLLAAMVPTIGFAVSVALSSESYGGRKHIWDILDPSNLSPLFDARKITFANELLYLFASVGIKLSVLLFYRRLADGILPKAFIWAIYGIAAFVLAYFVTTVISLFFTCQPLEGFWLRILPQWRQAHPGACISEGAAVLAISSISALQDFLVALLPTLLFARLPMPRKQKIALGAVFGFSFFLCVAGILRIVYVKRVFYDTYDVTWQLYDVWLWMIVEVLLGPICASAPALRVLFFRYVLPRIGVEYSITGDMSSHGHGSAYISNNRASVRDETYVQVGEDDSVLTQGGPAANTKRTSRFGGKCPTSAEEGWFHTMKDTEYNDQTYELRHHGPVKSSFD